MQERVAVVGPKTGVPLQDVEELLEKIYRKRPETIIVSGGLSGVDEHAEKTWLGRGGKVISFRPYQLTPESFCIQELRLAPLFDRTQPSVHLHAHPTFADLNSALTASLLMLIGKSDRVVCFMPDGQLFSEVEDFAAMERKKYHRL